MHSDVLGADPAAGSQFVSQLRSDVLNPVKARGTRRPKIRFHVGLGAVRIKLAAGFLSIPNNPISRRRAIDSSTIIVMFTEMWVISHASSSYLDNERGFREEAGLFWIHPATLNARNRESAIGVHDRTTLDLSVEV